MKQAMVLEIPGISQPKRGAWRGQREGLPGDARLLSRDLSGVLDIEKDDFIAIFTVQENLECLVLFYFFFFFKVLGIRWQRGWQCVWLPCHFLAFEFLLYLYPVQVCILIKWPKTEIYKFRTGKQVSWYQVGSVVSECHGMSLETEV